MPKLIVCLFLVSAAAFAADPTFEEDYRGQGFVQFGGGGCSVGVRNFVRTGCGFVGNLVGGGDAFVYRGLAIGGEGGWGWINNYFNEGLGVLSLNPSYHFKRGALVPFVTAGYTALVREGHLNGFNVGGGATWWAGRHAGLRMDGRLHHFAAGPLGANVFLFRVGLALR